MSKFDGSIRKIRKFSWLTGAFLVSALAFGPSNANAEEKDDKKKSGLRYERKSSKVKAKYKLDTKFKEEIKKQEQPMSMDDLIPTKENEEADQFNQSMMSEALEASTFKKAAIESKRKSMRSPSGSKHKDVHEVVQPKVSASVGPSASSSEIQSQIKMSA